MPYRFDSGEKLSPLQIAYLLVVAICAVGLVGLAYRLHQTDNNLSEQAARTSMLSQKLCETFSAGRVSGNTQVRAPLRETEYAIADIFRQSANQQKNNPQLRSSLNQLADKFKSYGDRVTKAGPVPCRFIQ